MYVLMVLVDVHEIHDVSLCHASAVIVDPNGDQADFFVLCMADPWGSLGTPRFNTARFETLIISRITAARISYYLQCQLCDRIINALY